MGILTVKPMKSMKAAQVSKTMKVKSKNTKVMKAMKNSQSQKVKKSKAMKAAKAKGEKTTKVQKKPSSKTLPPPLKKPASSLRRMNAKDSFKDHTDNDTTDQEIFGMEGETQILDHDYFERMELTPDQRHKMLILWAVASVRQGLWDEYQEWKPRLTGPMSFTAFAMNLLAVRLYQGEYDNILRRLRAERA